MTKQALINQIASNLPDNIVQAIEPKDMRDILNNIVTVAFDAQSYAAASFKGSAITSTDPGSPASAQYWFASEAGTYTNLGGLEVTSDDLSSNIVMLSFNGTTWIKQLIGVGIDLTNYYDKSSTDTAIDSKISDVIGSGTTNTLVVENFTESICRYGYTSAAYSGYGSPIGTPKGFNAVKIKVKIGATALTELHARVLTPNINPESTVVVLATKDVTGLNIAANSEQYFTIQFDDTIANVAGDNLYFQIYGDQLFQTLVADLGNQVFPIATYGNPSGQTNGTLNFTFTRFGSEFNLYTYISLIQAVINPDADFSDSVADASPKIQAIKTKADAAADTTTLVNNAMDWGYIDNGDHTTNFPIANASFKWTTATFSGWGTPIGTPQNFNSVKFKIRGKSGITGNITKVHCWVTKTDKNGEVLAQKEISGLTISVLEEQWLTVVFDDTIVNSASDALCFFFAADNLIDVFASAIGAGAPIQTPISCYTGIGIIPITPASFSDVSLQSYQTNTYVETFISILTALPTDNFTNAIKEEIDIPATPTMPELIEVEAVLPSKIFAIVGTETNIYWADFIHANIPLSELYFKVTCTKGTNYEKFYRVTPVTGDDGSYTWTLDIYFKTKLITTVSATLYISAANEASGTTRKILCVGDSTTAGGQYISIINTDHDEDVMSLTFIGTQGSSPNKHEGRSGWRISDFATAGRNFFKFIVSSIVTPPALNSIYSDGANQFTVREINLTSGSGYINTERTSGTGNPPASGTLTNVSGSGDGSVSFTSSEIVSGNPFWNTSTSSLDFSGYLSDNSFTMSSNDWVTIHLGINDVGGLTSDDAVTSALATIIPNLRNLINNIKSAVSGIRIGVCIPIPPSISQDAFGANYGTTLDLKRYLRNMKILSQKFLSEFDTDDERTGKTFLIPFNLILDRENNMQMGTWNANARNTTQITTYLNGVHPANPGYYQMGDQLWCFLKYMA